MPEIATALHSFEKTASPAAYGPQELLLGVATNRHTHTRLDAGLQSTTVRFSKIATAIYIDLETDPVLVDFLSSVKDRARNAVSLRDAAKKAVRAVVDLTQVDETGDYHQLRSLTLGQALTDPVECVDRALAMEAALKMVGLQDAQMLESVDRLPEGYSVNHADVQFTEGGDAFVAITMGDRAGEIMPKETYEGDYIAERFLNDLGLRQIKESWSYPYFETVVTPNGLEAAQTAGPLALSETIG